MKRPKRPAESKPGRVFQTGSSPTDSIGQTCATLTGLLVEWAARARVRECRMVAKADTPSQVQAMCIVRVVKDFGKDFHKMQLGRGGKCLACKGGIRTTNLKPQQPLIGIIFTDADPRYAGRFDDTQGRDTIVTMEGVREAIAFNAELADTSTEFRLTSEQMGFPLRPTGGREHEERAEHSDSSQRVRDHSVAYHFAPAITDFSLDENRECCNNDLEQTLSLLQSEWSKELEPLRQSSTHHPLIASNPIDKIDSEFMRRSMRWEAPSTPTDAHDPGLFREQETPLVVGKNLMEWCHGGTRWGSCLSACVIVLPEFTHTVSI